MSDLEILREIQQDMDLDARTLDGQPFTGHAVGEQLGNILAAVEAVARILEHHLAEAPLLPPPPPNGARHP